MNGSIKSAALALMVLCVGSTAADAAKIPIPCSGESIVHVLDIPATKGLEIPANKTMETKVLNLGYKFKNCFWGEWVGHLGSDSRYLPLEDAGLKALLTAAGLTEPPSRPNVFTHPGTHWAFWLWVTVCGCLAIAFVYKKAAAASSEPSDMAAHADVAPTAARVASPYPSPARDPSPHAAPRIPANRMATASRQTMPNSSRRSFGQR